MADNLVNTLLSILTMVRTRAESKGITPEISIAKLQKLLQSTGMDVSYQQIVDLTKDPVIQPSVESINKIKLVLSTGDNEDEASDTEMLPMDNNEPPAPDTDVAGDDALDLYSSDENEPQTNNSVDDNEEPEWDESPVGQMARRASRRGLKNYVA